MQAARGGEHHDVRIGVSQQLCAAAVTARPGSFCCRGEGGWIDVAYCDELRAVPGLPEGQEVVGCDPPAADQREAWPVAGDGRLEFDRVHVPRFPTLSPGQADVGHDGVTVADLRNQRGVVRGRAHFLSRISCLSKSISRCKALYSATFLSRKRALARAFSAMPCRVSRYI